MLAELTLKSGDETITIRPRPITVVVGPNGVGKSTLLREIKDCFAAPPADWDGRYVQDILIETGLAAVLAGETTSWAAKRLVAHYEKKLDWAVVAHSDDGWSRWAQLVWAWCHETLDELETQRGSEWTLAQLVSRRASALPLHTEALHSMHRRADSALSLLAGLGVGEVRKMLANVQHRFEEQLRLWAVESPRPEDATPARALVLAVGHAGLLETTSVARLYKDDVVVLDGAKRLRALTDRHIPSLLFHEEDLLNKVNQVLASTFDIELAVDIASPFRARDHRPVNLGQFLFQTEPVEPDTRATRDPFHLVSVPTSEAGAVRTARYSVAPEARQIMAALPNVSELSDGTRAFISLLASALDNRRGLTLVDEPEAFLHPPLARSIAQHLTEASVAAGGTNVYATHSPHFLCGCLESGHPVTVVRLDIDRSTSARTVTALQPERLQDIRRNPLLQSDRAMEILFAETTVLVEGESDAVLYRAAFDQTSPAPLICAAMGVGSIPKLLEPMREMRVRIAAVVDFDVLLPKGNFIDLMKAVGASEAALQGYKGHHSAVCNWARGKGNTAEAKARGRAALPADVAQAVDELLNAAARRGLFILPHGDLEAWQPFHEDPIARRRDKLRWIYEFAERRASGERLSKGLYEFADRVANWLASGA